MLEKLRQCSNVEEIAKYIKDFYHLYDIDNYIPGIYKEGSFLFTKKEDNNGEFYAKLILRPKDIDINQTWLKGNLQYGFIDGSDDREKNDIGNYIYNVIVQKNFYRNSIYTLNPYLYNDNNSYIYEKVQDTKNVANLVYYNVTFSTNEWPVLVSKGDNEILFLKESISDYVNSEENHYPQYTLSVEFEYRDKINNIKEFDKYVNSGCLITKERIDDFVWLLGTIDIDFVIPKDRKLNIITNQLNGNIRKIDESNWNDDMDAGLIVFNNKCLKYLKERYIFIELSMIDMHTKDSILVDFVGNRVVFWEGEFNKLPYEVKKKLEQYNVRKKCKGIISKAMFEWQLNCNLDYDKYEYPYQKIGKKVFENYFDIAFESGLSLDLPRTSKELKDKIDNLLKIFSVEFNELYKYERGFITLEKIMNNKYKPTVEESKQLFDYFCYNLLGVIDNDK